MLYRELLLSSHYPLLAEDGPYGAETWFSSGFACLIGVFGYFVSNATDFMIEALLTEVGFVCIYLT